MKAQNCYTTDCYTTYIPSLMIGKTQLSKIHVTLKMWMISVVTLTLKSVEVFKLFHCVLNIQIVRCFGDEADLKYSLKSNLWKKEKCKKKSQIDYKTWLNVYCVKVLTFPPYNNFCCKMRKHGWIWLPARLETVLDIQVVLTAMIMKVLVGSLSILMHFCI